MTWTGLLRAVGGWFRENLPRAIITSAASFGFAWLVNFVVMAFRWDGFRAPAEGGSDYIAADSSLITGSLFWAGVMSLLFALVSYGHRVGWQQLVQEVLSLPSSIRQMFRGEERNRSLTTVAWAGMLSMLLGLLISPAVAAIAAGFFVVFAATPLGALLTGAIRRLWMQLVVRFAPHKGEPTSEVGAAAVSAAGMVAGFAVAAVLDSLLVGILAVILLGLAAYYFANEDELGSGTGTAVFLLVAAGVGLHELFEAGVGIAFADDGGWSECGNCNIIDYVTSTGATEVVVRSTVAAGSAGVGAPVGAAVGDILGTIGGGSGPADAGGPAGGGGGGTTGDHTDAILGAIGGGEGGTLTPSADAGGSAPADDGTRVESDAGAPAARTGPVDAPATRPREARTGAAAPTGAEGEAANPSDADAILGAIGGGEGGVDTADGDTGGVPGTAPGARDQPVPEDRPRPPTSPRAGDPVPNRRGNAPPQDAPGDEPTDGPPPDRPPPAEPPPPPPQRPG